MHEQVEKFISELEQSLNENTFVKLTVGNYKGPEKQLQKLLVRLVSTRKGMRLFFLYRSDARDTAKNYDLETGIRYIREAFNNGFRSGHLFTTTRDIQLDIGKRNRARLNVGKPTFTDLPAVQHDREKKTLVAADSFYLKALGITDDNGRVRDRERDKWRQVNKFVEVISNLVDHSGLRSRKDLRIVDMGSGKGYLTFAAYDHFRNTRGVNVTMVGVEVRQDLVDLDNGVAAAAGFEGLSFVTGTISDQQLEDVDILIALHACDTATDDALFKGMIAGAEIIIAAPCCHHELRPQIKPPPMLKDILKHGVMLERIAETLTDGLRSLLLERRGYATKLFEFVSVEHTPKNNLLVATRLAKPGRPEGFDEQIEAIMKTFAIERQHLHSLLSETQP